MYFGHLYFGPKANKDYFGCLYFGPVGVFPAGVGPVLMAGGGSTGGVGLDRLRPHPWLIREWEDEEILTILSAIMRTIDN